MIICLNKASGSLPHASPRLLHAGICGAGNNNIKNENAKSKYTM
jgi:hypothetical protein